MITRQDLKTVEINVDVDTTEWRHVEAPDGRKFLLSATSLTKEDVLKMHPILAMTYLSVPAYMVESVVYPSDDNWEIKGECNETCAQGICTRRVAQDRNVGSIDTAYDLLLNYLNS